MYKYEEAINKRIKEYDWNKTIEVFRNDDGTVEQWVIDVVYRDFRMPLDANARHGLESHYYYNEYGVFKKDEFTSKIAEVPIKEIECAMTNNLPTEEGLYFVGMIGNNPIGEEYYLVKVGTAKNIKKRLQDYATYNPMIYIGGYLCVSKNRELCETRCHNFLTSMAYAQAQNSKEWFYVDKETYFALCDIFGDMDKFEIIAKENIEW